MIRGALSALDFLEIWLGDTDVWKQLDDAAMAASRYSMRSVFDNFPHDRTPNETQTENDLIWKVVSLLGWSAHLRQIRLDVKGREHVPDGILFADGAAKARANRQDHDHERYGDGLAIVESKRWDRPLDRRAKSKDEAEVPSTQMLRYLRRLDILTDGRVRWAKSSPLWDGVNAVG